MQQSRRTQISTKKYRELRKTKKHIHKAKKKVQNDRTFEELEHLQNQHKIKKFYQNINNAERSSNQGQT